MKYMERVFLVAEEQDPTQNQHGVDVDDIIRCLSEFDPDLVM